LRLFAIVEGQVALAYTRRMSRLSRIAAAALPVLFFAAAGCSSTVCDQALDHVEECGIQNAQLTDSGEECAEYAACSAECVLDAGCNDIQDALALGENSLTDCVAVCGQ
jgi:hypothetical protein